MQIASLAFVIATPTQEGGSNLLCIKSRGERENLGIVLLFVISVEPVTTFLFGVLSGGPVN
jgi:hypothetical protein